VKISKLWQWVKQHLVVSIFITGLVIFLVVSFIGGYFFNWLWTGFSPYTSTPHATNITFQREKTLWDWLQLLIIPLVIAIGGYLFNLAVSRTEQRNTTDNQQETALQAYIDKMSELLLHENLRKSAEDAEVRKIARVRTLTVLSKLDASRKRSVMQFLHESDLINKSDPSSETECIVHLQATDRDRSSGADLSGADLSGLSLGFSDLHKVNLRNANLSKANLSEAVLSGADLSGANLREARLSWGKLVIDPTGTNLEGADLSGADLSSAIMNDVILIEADLSGAKLSDADLSGANLKGVTGITVEELEQQAKSLKGATMSDGPIHP